MTINGIVERVYLTEDGAGFLELSGDERGQPKLYFDAAPHDVSALTGKRVWGGSSEIMHGERRIAQRLGYTRIEFSVESIIQPGGDDGK